MIHCHSPPINEPNEKEKTIKQKELERKEARKQRDVLRLMLHKSPWQQDRIQHIMLKQSICEIQIQDLNMSFRKYD